MELETVQRVIDNVTKGSNIVLEWIRPAKVKTSCESNIQKYVLMVGRVGIDYDNQQVVKEKRESGELPSERHPIWNGKGEWVIFPYLIRHVVTGELYVRLYESTSKAIAPKVEWMMDGVPVDYEDVEPFLLASEKKSEKDGDCFCCKLGNMVRIANEADWLVEVDETEIHVTTTPIEAEAEIA